MEVSDRILSNENAQNSWKRSLGLEPVGVWVGFVVEKATRVLDVW
jgi:hypothetical protein